MTRVLCHGCFDILHAGHLAYFKAAKKFGDHLTVSVTTDQHVNKGPGRPYFSHGQRAEMVKALGIVDDVIISDSPTAVQVIEQVKPDFYVKGPDYKDLTKDVTGEIYNEKAAVEKYGGQLVFTEEETFSSSTIINKFFQGWGEEQKACIETIRSSHGGLSGAESAIERLNRLRVLVIGEPILDIYRFVNPEGISSKSPTVSARFIREEHYNGGSIAIANHLEDFCSVSADRSTGGVPVKIRYISGNQRIFEVTHIDESFFEYGQERISAELIDSSPYDVIVAADFGHGLFEGHLLDALAGAKSFVGLNVQTNSSNFGFNVYTKHKRWDYLCLDTREIRLAHNERHSDPMVLGQSTWNKSGKPLSITLGPNGSALWTKEGVISTPAFSDTVVDATGAGDAYFAITTLLMATGCHPELVTFIGNIFAGLKTRIIGNKHSVSKASLLKALKGILA